MRIKVSLLTIVIQLFLISNIQSQCAYDYEGIYGGRPCSFADTISSYYIVTTIEAVDSARLLLSNIHWAGVNDLCGAEDTIFLNLNCDDMSLVSEYICYDISCEGSTGDELCYSGLGLLYSDSIRVTWIQDNPDYTQEICMVYLKDDFFGIEEPSVLDEVKLYPNPSNGIVYIDEYFKFNSIAHILDLSGNVVKTINIDAGVIDISELISGRYFIELKDKNRRKRISSVVKY